MANEPEVTQESYQISSEKTCQDFVIKTKINKMAFLASILFAVLSARLNWKAMNNNKYSLFDALKIFFSYYAIIEQDFVHNLDMKMNSWN